MADIEMVRGETLDLEIAVVDGDGDEVDLLGHTVEWRLSTGMERSTADDSITIAGNLARLRIAPADTLALPNRERVYHYEAKVMNSAGVVKCVIEGDLTITPTLVELEPAD